MKKLFILTILFLGLFPRIEKNKLYLTISNSVYAQAYGEDYEDPWVTEFFDQYNASSAADDFFREVYAEQGYVYMGGDAADGNNYINAWQLVGQSPQSLHDLLYTDNAGDARIPAQTAVQQWVFDHATTTPTGIMLPEVLIDDLRSGNYPWWWGDTDLFLNGGIKVDDYWQLYEDENPDDGSNQGDGGNDLGTIPSSKINDISSFIDCFGSTNATTSTYRLKVFVEEPQPGSSGSSAGGGTGHTFIGITKDGITQYVGFYPSEDNPILLLGQSVEGELHNNGGSPYTVSKTYVISKDQFESGIAYIGGFNGSSYPYSLVGQNCTDYAYDLFNYLGINLPTGSASGLPIENSPQQLGTDLRDSGGANPTSGVAPLSYGPCN